jgi:hypothetical protein
MSSFLASPSVFSRVSPEIPSSRDYAHLRFSQSTSFKYYLTRKCTVYAYIQTNETPYQVLKSARSSRGRLRTGIVEIILNAPELGIASGISEKTLASRIRKLKSENRFLDASPLFVSIKFQISNII